MLLKVHSFYYNYFDNKSERTHHISTQKPFFPSFVVKNNNIRQLPLIQNNYYFKMNKQRQAKKTQQNLYSCSKKTFSFFKNYPWYQISKLKKNSKQPLQHRGQKTDNAGNVVH